MIAQFDARIAESFEWRDYLEGTPRLSNLPLAQQRELVAAYLDENPADLYEVLNCLDQSAVFSVCDLIRHPSNVDTEFADALFNAGIAALSLDINECIERMYLRYVDEYGVFSAPSRHDPEELIGWRSEYE